MGGYAGPSGVTLYDASGNPITSGAPASNLVNANLQGLDVRAFLHALSDIAGQSDQLRTMNADFTPMTGEGMLAVHATVQHGGGDFRAVTSASVLGDGHLGINTPPAVATLFNASTYDRARAASAASLAASVQPYALMTGRQGEWCIFDCPAAATQALATKAAGAAGVKHVATQLVAITGSIAGGTLAANTVDIVEDIAGAATVLVQFRYNMSGGAQNPPLVISLNFPQPTAARSLSIRFGAAGAANTYQSVALFGYSVS